MQYLMLSQILCSLNWLVFKLVHNAYEASVITSAPTKLLRLSTFRSFKHTNVSTWAHAHRQTHTHKYKKSHKENRKKLC